MIRNDHHCFCILGLSSVLGRNIYTYYPDCGEARYKLFLNCLVKPCLPTKQNLEDLHSLFCFVGHIKPGDTFWPDHFVPLLFYSNQSKRKLQASKSSTSKKRTCANIKQFFRFLNQFMHQKTTNETFSSSAAYAAAVSNSFTHTVPPESGGLTGNQLISVTDSTPSTFDVSLFREKVKGMDSPQNVFKPDKKFSFPKTNGRCFRYNWLELHSSWLCYSLSKDGTYCLSCVLFGDRFPGKASKFKNLFSVPFRH